MSSWEAVNNGTRLGTTRNNYGIVTSFPGFCNDSRRVSIVDDDLRECPTQQEENEIKHCSFYCKGDDERRGWGHNLSRSSQDRMGERYFRQGHDFREARDSNSFDYDSEDEFVIHRKLLRRRHVRKNRLQKERERQLTAAAETTLRNAFGASTSNNCKNKRKSSSPVVLEEAHIEKQEAVPSMPEAMSVDDGDEPTQTTATDTSFDDSTSFDPSPETEEGYDLDNYMALPPPARRISLSSISRRLASQFDTISFFSPVKPSQHKRRKTRDTSIVC